MATQEHPLLLPEEDRRLLAIKLHTLDLFGVVEDLSKPKTLKSGRESPHYLNMRPGISNARFRHFIADEMTILANAVAQTRAKLYGRPLLDARSYYDHAAGTPEAMTSYAVNIADKLNLGLLQPRVATNKESGNKVPILGEYEPGDLVAVFDDVVTDGQSKIDTIDQFNQAGLNVGDYFVVLDREEGGGPKTEEVTGIAITPALGVSSLMKILRAEDLVSVPEFDAVARYLEQYGEPHARETINTPI